MRMLSLLLLLAMPSVAQVANFCGPGKNCSARKFTSTAKGGAGICVQGPNADWGWSSGTSASVIGWYAAGSKCSGAPTSLINMSVNEGIVTSATSGGWRAGTGGFQASQAFASFPACAAGSNGNLLYDSTNTAWRECRSGSGWVPLGPRLIASDVTTYFPGLAALLNVSMARVTWPRTLFGAAGVTSFWGIVSLQLQQTVTLVPGTGAGNAVFTIYNVTNAAATSATVTVPCASTAGTVTTGTSDASIGFGANSKELDLRLTTNGCTTLPILNVTWGHSVLPAGS